MAFTDATRQAIRQAGAAQTISLGNRSIITLPETGLLARIHLHVSAVVTLVTGTGTHTLGSKGPYNLIKEVRLLGNQNTDIFRLSGFGAHVLDVLSAGRFWEPQDGQLGYSYATAVYNAPVDAGANTWEFDITINVARNDRDAVGLLMLQTDQLSADLVVEWNTAVGGATIQFPVVLTGDATATLTSGTMTATIETFSLPAARTDWPDILTVYQQLETQQAIAGTGENTVKLLRANVYERLTHVVETNGALDPTNVDQLAIRYNNSDSPYDIARKPMLALQRRRYGRDLPPGVYVHDFAYQGQPGFGGTRDLINAAAITDFASVLDINSGTTLGSGNNFIRTIQQQFVRIRPPAGMADGQAA